MTPKKTFFSPITRKRLARFRKMKLARASLWALAALYIISLGSELVCNGNPLYVRYEGRSYFPVLFFYPESDFMPGGAKTRPDYKAIRAAPSFSRNPENFMIFPPVECGPYESADPQSIAVADHVTVLVRKAPRLGSVNISPEGLISRAKVAGSFFGLEDQDVSGLDFFRFFERGPDLKQALDLRFSNQDAPRAEIPARDAGGLEVLLSLSTFSPRSRAPETVRITLKDPETVGEEAGRLAFDPDGALAEDPGNIWASLPQPVRAAMEERAKARVRGPVAPLEYAAGRFSFKADFAMEEVRFPYPPTRGHWMGIDSAGRDVFARILYGLRTSLTFGLILVVLSMVLGAMAGAVQGYYGGFLDISGQRLTEIWSAIPFLYVMILLGSVYGRSFALLLFCYALFNWIGISYYMRGEFLRLRKLAFVESAKCLGIPDHKIMFRHILPNGLTPIITFFPFSLVGAIGALAALDYLGFGLPPPTPSWGELLAQAQSFRWAWWLILYPSLALFVVMLLGVFIGEGVRNAFDPKQFSRLK